MNRRATRIVSQGLGALLLAATLTGCARSRADVADPASVPAGRSPESLEVTRGDLTVRVLLTGEITAETASQLISPHVSIPLTIRWLVEDGAEVRAGERVVEFDNSQLMSSLENQRLQVVSAFNSLASLRAQAAADEAQAIFDLEQSRAQLEKARLEAESAHLLAPIEREKMLLNLETAELDFEKAGDKLESTRRSKQAEIEIQEISLKKARAAVARAEADIERLSMKAARDGIVTLQVNWQHGRPYQVGDNAWSGQPIARMPDLSTLIVQARLFDVDDHRIAAGMPVRATLDAFPGETFTGTIREIDRIARDSERESLRRFFRTLVDLDDIDPERMRPGMSVKLELESTHPNVLRVPRPGLDWSPGGARALLADGTWRPVTLGACNASTCVVEDGLDESAVLRPVPRGPAAL